MSDRDIDDAVRSVRDMVTVIRGYVERHGNFPKSATMTLLDRCDHLYEVYKARK